MMLSVIRDKLKTWVVVILVVLVAIPLVFLGVGDYGTNQEQYAFKVNDQEVSRSIVLQEMGQFKDVLRKNYQGTIPPIYTDQFIKKITIDNLIRRNIENNISSNIGLVFSDESIIEDIKNTSSFRDESGFSSQLYKKRLYMINMNPEVYEQYIYQKGIRQQLRKSITETSILSVDDKKININANYHKKNGKLYILRASETPDDIKVSLDEINNYYENNKESFKSEEKATFSYLRLNKKSMIDSITINDEELKRKYDLEIASGQHKLDKSYEINHLVFPVTADRDSVIETASQAYKELSLDTSFKDISSKYKVSDDTKKNLGYLGHMNLNDLPDVIRLNIATMKIGETKLITSESNAIHIVKILGSKDNEFKSFQKVRDDIKDRFTKSVGSEKYFSTLDKIKEKIYSQNIPLEEISSLYNLELINSSVIDKSYSDNVLSSEVINKLFYNGSTQGSYPPIYISNDDVLFIKMDNYYPPNQLSLNESEEAIGALLRTQKIKDKFNSLAKDKLTSLNSGKDTYFENFSLYKYDDAYEEEVIKIIHNQPITSDFRSFKLKSSDYLFVKVDSIDLGNFDRDKIDSDNFLDYLSNTQSESDYNSFYLSKYDLYQIDINEDYLNQ